MFFLFELGDEASLIKALTVRFILIALGISFSAPYHAWALERVPSTHRYLILSFGFALGSQWIGAPTSAICLWLYHITKWHCAPGVYLAFLGLLASSIILYHKNQLKKQIPIPD